jgi:hypothetical protein
MEPTRVLSAEEIVRLHDETTRDWHDSPPAHPDLAGRALPTGESADWLDRVAQQHRANFELWHIEDEARAPFATDPEIADVKRRVDRTNQRRNDLVESLDRTLLDWLCQYNLPNPNAHLHSETPGLIIDRLSILALKIYHTREEAGRAGAPSGHAGRNRERLAILLEQRGDLAACLDELWRETLAGTRQFKLYRQLKMYNDPSLNPAIYSSSLGRSMG